SRDKKTKGRINLPFLICPSVQEESSQTANTPYWWQYDHVQYASHNLAESDKVQSHPPTYQNLLPWLLRALLRQQGRHQNVQATLINNGGLKYLDHLYRL